MIIRSGRATARKRPSRENAGAPASARPPCGVTAASGAPTGTAPRRGGPAPPACSPTAPRARQRQPLGPQVVHQRDVDAFLGLAGGDVPQGHGRRGGADVRGQERLAVGRERQRLPRGRVRRERLPLARPPARRRIEQRDGPLGADRQRLAVGGIQRLAHVHPDGQVLDLGAAEGLPQLAVVGAAQQHRLAVRGPAPLARLVAPADDPLGLPRPRPGGQPPHRGVVDRRHQLTAGQKAQGADAALLADESTRSLFGQVPQVQHAGVVGDREERAVGGERQGVTAAAQRGQHRTELARGGVPHTHPGTRSRRWPGFCHQAQEGEDVVRRGQGQPLLAGVAVEQEHAPHHHRRGGHRLAVGRTPPRRSGRPAPVGWPRTCRPRPGGRRRFWSWGPCR